MIRQNFATPKLTGQQDEERRDGNYCNYLAML